MAQPIEHRLYGCVNFDDVRHHNAGWASIAGQTAYRIASTKDLQSDVSWLTNLDYDMSYKAGFAVHAGFRRSDYLSEYFIKADNKALVGQGFESARFDFSKMLDVDSNNGALLTQRSAVIFDRLMRLSNRWLNLQDLPLYTLANGFRERLIGHDAVLPGSIVTALTDATASFVWTERNDDSDKNNQLLTLILPRVTHGVKCATLQEPKGDWVPLSLPSTNEQDIDEWVSNHNGYLVVQMAIDNMNEEANRLINFGSGRSARQWITGIELSELNKRGKVTLKKAYRPTTLEPLQALEPLLAMQDDVHDLSFSTGLFWQNIWTGLCAKKTPPAHILKTNKSINSLAPFIRATDRNACFLAALTLQKKGLQVVSYGKGRITISYDGNANRLAEHIRQTQLIPSFLNSVARQDVAIDTPIQMLQEIYLQGDFKRLNDADQQITESLCQN